MTAQYRYDEILEMLPAFALGALEADEMLAVEEYLRTKGTPDLLVRLETLEDSAAVMAMNAPTQPLPVHLKNQLFDAIQADLTVTEERPSVTTPVVPKVTRSQPQGIPDSTDNSFARWMAALGGLFRPVAWAAVGAVLAFVLLQTLNPSSQAELETVRADVQRLEGQLATLQTDLEAAQENNLALQQINQSLQSQLSNSDQQLAVLAHASHAIPLAGQEAAPEASGTLYVGQGESVVVLAGLEVLPENQTYQLWLIPADGDGAPLPSGLLAVQQAGVDSVTITLPDDATNYAAVGVSIEPAGGSPSPTGPIVLVGVTAS
jgi:hypothetical protein